MITQHLFLYTLYGLRQHFLIFSYISSRVLLFYLWHCRLVVDGTHAWLLELVESRWKVGLNTVIWLSMNVFYLAHHTERNNLSDYFQLKVAVMLVFSSPPHLAQYFQRTQLQKGSVYDKLSQVRLPRKQTRRQRFACTRFFGECLSSNTYQGGMK